MSFSRVNLPESFFKGDELTSAMAGIGIHLSTKPLINPNIEDVLISASIEALNEDWRTLSLLVDWIFKHSTVINVDRLTRAITELKKDTLLIAFWSTIAKNLHGDIRFKRLASLYKGQKFLLGASSGELFLKRNGPDERFKLGKLIIPNKMLRSRPSDIIDLSDLVKLHRGIYYRVLVGPTYRADCLQLLETSVKQSVSSLAKKSYSSYRTAWETLNDWKIIHLVD